MATVADLSPAQRRATGREWTSARWAAAGPAARLWTGIRCRAERVAAQVRVPAEIRALAPVESGERILAFAHSPDGALVLATDRALRYQGGGSWSRLVWERVGRIAWDDERNTLAVTDAGSARVADVALHATDGPRLTDLARERVGSTFLLSTMVALSGRRHARVTARRQPGSDRTLWQVDLGGGGDPADPTVRAEIATAIARLGTHFEVSGEGVGVSGRPG
jgi:hypothetical protein